jgi:4-amino-4-deoxy-L-arabinose transferase-like glycosyltransferase
MTRQGASMTAEQNRELEQERAGWQQFALVALVGAILFGIRLTAPPNLLDQDQERPASYVLDAVRNGHWICQRDLSGDITSKPPLYTWLCAITTLIGGRITLFALYLPGAVAATGTALLLLQFGRKYFGARAALFGALACLFSPAGLKEFGLARTDGVFAFTVTAGALLAFHAWQTGRRWTWVWLVAAAATLTKGPLGIALAGGGLLAAWWEKKSGHPQPLRGSHLAGILLFLVLTAGWFLAAYMEFGDALIAKLIGKELVGHVVSSGKKALPGSHFYQPPLYYLSRAAPWSLLAYYGLWRVWKHPSAIDGERRFERFLFCWFLVGLLIFSLAPHQRADLLWPIMPAGALIAGRELARFTAPLRPRIVQASTAILVVLAMAGFAVYYFEFHSRQRAIQDTLAVRDMAKTIEARAGREFPLTHVDAPVGLQVYLNTLCPRISARRAAELLRGPEAAYVAVRNLGPLEAERLAGDPSLFTLLPETDSSTTPVRIVANRPAFKLDQPTAFCFGELWVRFSGARLLRATEPELCFLPAQSHPEVQLTNESDKPRRIRLCLSNQGVRISQERTLAPRETWKSDLSIPDSRPSP